MGRGKPFRLEMGRPCVGPWVLWLLTLDLHLGEGLGGAHSVGDLAAVAAGVLGASGLQA